MLDLRTIALGLGIFCATFLVGWWLDIGKLGSTLMATPAASNATAAPSASPTPTSPAPASRIAARPSSKSPERKELFDDRLAGEAVIAWSKAYRQPACNQDARWGYVNAATKYAQELMRAAGCPDFQNCPITTAQLGRVWIAKRSPADVRVAEAMAAANGAGGLSSRDFRGDVARVVVLIANRDFERGPAPACSSQSSRNSWSIRIRRR